MLRENKMKFGKILICLVLVISFSLTSLAATFFRLDEFRMYDSYGKLSWKSERQRLEALAYELKNNYSKDVVYFYLYGGRGTCISKIEKRATRAKNYLIKKHEILSERIVSKVGGYRDKATIEIYIQPQDFTMDASPTLMASEVQKKCNNQ